MRIPLIVAAMLACTSAVQSQDAEALSLKGVRAVKVGIGGVDAAAIAAGVDTVSLRVQVELRLRSHGLIVSPHDSAADGLLLIGLRIQQSGLPALWALAMHVGLWQPTTLVRTSQGPFVVPTWGHLGVSTMGQNMLKAGVQSSVEEAVDGFLNDWLSVNPPKR